MLNATPKSQLICEDKKEDLNDGFDPDELIKLIEEHIRNDDHETATFWAEKLIAISANKSIDEKLPEWARYMTVLTAARNWQMIITFINRNDLFLMHLIFAYFHVNALYQREMYSEIVALPIGYLKRWDDVPFIAPDNASYIYAESNAIRIEETRWFLDALVKERKCESRLLFLLAKTYLMVQNRPAAVGCLRHCIRTNPYSSEALHLAVDSRLLKPSEIQRIFSTVSLPNKSGARVLKQLLEFYDLNNEPSTTSGPIWQTLSSDLSIQAALAFRLYCKGCINEAYKITSGILHEFGHYTRCFLVHIGCLVSLGKVSELYSLGHSMVRLQPEKEITWYTVGCYYYTTGQYTTAKKFLNKCTLMNAGFGEGWLAYGHALFYVEEHEQAMNCYLRASRILEGHFEPLLYIAVEYSFANNFKLANDFLHDAELIAGANAIVLHERGTAAFMEKNYEKAESVFIEALLLVTNQNSNAPVSSMLAVEVKGSNLIAQSLVLATNKAEAWGCIGVCHALMAADPAANLSDLTSVDSAIEALNKALALKPGDDLLKGALDKVLIFSATAIEPELKEQVQNEFKFESLKTPKNSRVIQKTQLQKETSLVSQLFS